MNTRKGKIILVMLLLILIGVFYVSGVSKHIEFKNIQLHLDFIRDYYSEKPVLSTVLFISLYILLTSLSIPGSIVLTMLSGTLFGIFYGTLLVTLCSSIGASIAFLMSRYLFRKTVLQKFKKQFKVIDNRFRKNGKSYLFTLRLIPASPFVVINLLMGLTPISLWTFTWITFLGMLPGGLIYVYAGRKLAEISSPAEILSWPIISLLTLLGLMPFFFKAISKITREHFKEPQKQI